MFLPNITSVVEFINVSTLMYKVCKSVSAFPFNDPVVNEVSERNHRLGNSVTGFLQSQWVNQYEDFTKVYRHLEELDADYSRELGVGESVKLTTVKPSGTLSLLPGVTSGVHPAFAKHYIRRVRFSSIDPLIDVCRDRGYPVEPVLKTDGSRDLNTMIVSFPVRTPNGTVLAKDVTAIDQMKLQQLMQTYWSDNSVSVTCYYRKEELPDIHQYLRESYDDSIKSVSFCLHADHGFLQAPHEEIDEKEYNRLSEKIQPIVDLKDDSERVLADSVECASGACPVR